MKQLLIVVMIFAYSNSYSQIEMNVLGHWSDSLVDNSNANIPYNEVWGVAINDHEYAVVGAIDGTHFIDITDPQNPIKAFFVEGAYNSADVVHRDYHDYEGYLYAVCDEGHSTLQIIDMNYLPDSLIIVSDNSDLLITSHNIFIDSLNKKLYHTGGSNEGAVTVYNLDDPINPQKLGAYKNFNNTNTNYAHDVHVRNDTAYLNCGNDGLFVLDLTNQDSVRVIGELGSEEYPFSGYNHSGWLTEDGKTYVMADETNYQDVKIFDVENLPEINLHTTINPDNEGDVHIPHNPIIKGKYLYVSYYNNGLQVWDIEDPQNPIRTHHFVPETSPYTWGIYPFLPSGNIIISDIRTGLYILEGIDINVAVTPLDNNNAQIMEVFPNPATTSIQINIEKIEGDATYKIYNNQGVLFQTGRLGPLDNGLNLELPSEMSRGLYFVEIVTHQDRFLGKFIKK